MTYSKEHLSKNCGRCDKCDKDVGKDNLIKLPFLYLDKNDDVHPDMSRPGMEPGYRSYQVCKSCYNKEVKK